MTALFASQEWADQFGTRLQESATVRTESMSWVFGPIALIIDADSEHDLDATLIRIDLHEGAVRGVTVGDVGDSALIPFAVGGSLARWKAVFAGSLPLMDGILQSKLRVRGDLPTLARHGALLEAVNQVGGELQTLWQDEREVAAQA